MSRIEDIDQRLNQIRAAISHWEMGSSENGWSARVADANRVFAEILDVEMDLQDLFLIHKVPFDPERRVTVFAVLEPWLSKAEELLARISGVGSPEGLIEGAEEFQANVKQIQAMLTPDDAFFFSDDCCEKIGAKVKQALENGEVEFVDVHNSVE